MIALLCPTKGRPKQFSKMVKSALSTSNTRPKIFTYHGDGAEGYDLNGIEWLKWHDMPTVAKWNHLAMLAMRNPETKLFMLASDDIVFATPCWSDALVERYNNLENKIHVFALLDSRDPDGVPHPIVTREWIEALGYAFPPIFLHWQLDTWTVEIAKANGCFTHLRDYLLVHEKPSDVGLGDETHNHIRSLGWRERDQQVASVCAHFLEFEKRRLMAKIHQAKLAA